MTIRSKKTALFAQTTLGLALTFSAAAQETPPAAKDASAAAKSTQLAQATSAVAPALPQQGPEAIVVTARRRAERLQDVPISIKVFNQQQLNNHNVVTAQDLATYTPSLSANTDFGSQNTTFAIRGFVQDIGTSPSVATYFADVVAPRGGANNIPTGDGASAGEFFDLQNVQVLKGPQGTLFGLNTTGGAVLLVPQRPTSDLGGYIETSYGNYDMKRVQAVVNLPIGDKIRFRFGLDHETRDGYAKNDTGIGPSNFDDLGYLALRASLDVDVTPDIENYTIFSYSRSDDNGDLQKLIGCNPSKNLKANFLGILACAQLAQEQAKGAGFYTVQNSLANPESELKQFQIIDTTTWLAADTLTIKNIISYAQLVDNLNSALFGTNFDLHNALPSIFKPGTVVDFAQSLVVPGGSTANEATFTEELQFQGRTGDSRLTYQGGLYAELSDPLGVVGSQSPLLLSCTNSATFDCINPVGSGRVNRNDGRRRLNDLAVYSQATYAITDQLKLTAGARYTWDSSTNTSQFLSYHVPQPGVGIPSCVIPGTSLPFCTVHIRESSRAPTWTLDLRYQPYPDLNLYATYSRGYRAGGITPQIPAPYDTFQAERVNTYEIGVKKTFLDSVKGILDIDGFYNDFGNQQLQVGFDPAPGATVSPASGIVNAGKSRIYGAEVDASITPFTGVTFDVDYTYLDTELLRISPIVTPAGSPYVVADQILAGDPLALSPKNKVALTGTYTLPLNPEIGRVTFGATFTHVDSQVSNYADSAAVNNPSVAALGTLQSRNLLDLNLNWYSVMGSPFDISFFATNVTQDKYYTFVPGLYSASTGFETAQLGEPCFYGARVRFRFGG